MSVKHQFEGIRTTSGLERSAAIFPSAEDGVLNVAQRGPEAGPDDRDVFEALERFRSLRKARDVAEQRLSEAELQCLVQKGSSGAGPDLGVTGLPPVCEASSDPSNFGVPQQVLQVLKAEEAYKLAYADAAERIGLPEANNLFESALSAATDAGRALLDLTPRTTAGLRAIVAELADDKMLDGVVDAESLARLILRAPALEARF